MTAPVTEHARAHYNYYQQLSKHFRGLHSSELIFEYITEHQGVDMVTIANDLGMHLPRVMEYVGEFMREDKVQWFKEE